MTAKTESPLPPLLSGPIVFALLRRPDLWPTIAKVGLSLAASGWWRSKPFLPLPDRKWLHFRFVTVYGGSGGDTNISAPELLEWLEWRKEISQLTSE